MAVLNLTFELSSESKRIVTTGNIWRRPIGPGDAPITSLVLVVGEPKSVSLEQGNYVYKFQFNLDSTQQATLTKRYAITPAPGPQNEVVSSPGVGQTHAFDFYV